MKAKAAIIVLLVLSLGLGGGLYYRHTKAVEETRKNEANILVLSNDLKNTSARLSEQQIVNLALETNLSERISVLNSVSNKLLSTEATLAKTEAEAAAAAKAAEEELAKRDAEIAKLESERDSLTQKMTELNVSIGSLETQIADTQKKLAASEGDREFLLKELQRLQAEKAELERQFTDLAILREQVKKLKDELSISRRLEWIRRGLYGADMKGGQRLQKGFAATPTNTNNYNLNVEISPEGAKVVPPATPPPAQPETPPAPK